jgi:hypothetical protein
MIWRELLGIGGEGVVIGIGSNREGGWTGPDKRRGEWQNARLGVLFGFPRALSAHIHVLYEFGINDILFLPETESQQVIIEQKQYKIIKQTRNAGRERFYYM